MKGRRGIVKMLLAALLAPVLLLGLPWVGSAVASSTWVAATQTGSNVDSWEIFDYAVPDPGCAMRAKWSDYDGLGDVSATLAVEGSCEWVFSHSVTSVVLTGAPTCTITVPVSSEGTSPWWDPSDETAFSGSLDTFTGCEVNAATLHLASSGKPDAEVYMSIPLGDATEGGVPSGGCTFQLLRVYSQVQAGTGSEPTPNTSWAYIRYIVEVYVPAGEDHLWFDAGMTFVGSTAPNKYSFTASSAVRIGTGGDSAVNALLITPWPDVAEGGVVSFAMPYMQLDANDPRPSGWHGASGIASQGTPTGISTTSTFNNQIALTPQDGSPGNNYFPGESTADTINPTEWGTTEQGTGCTYWLNRPGVVTPEADAIDPDLGAEDDPLPDTAEPVGSEPETEAGCSFSLTDPTTWASGGICALVYLMKKAVALLGKILRALGSGLSLAWDGLVALWVPDQDHWQDSVADVRQAFDDSGPGEWGGAVSDTVTAVGGLDDAAGGCDGPTLSGEVAGVGYDLDPLDSCDAPMSTVANMVKVLLTLFVAVGGILACAQPLAGALGLQFRTPEEKA